MKRIEPVVSATVADTQSTVQRESSSESQSGAKSASAPVHFPGQRLPLDAQERKELQLYTFMFGYFPDSWLAMVGVARAGNKQHNPGQPLHWARHKSTDQMNAAFNHLFDYGTGVRKDTDGQYHLAKVLWRVAAQLQLDIEEDRRNGQA